MQSRNLKAGETTWLLVLLILFVCAQAADAAKCNHCGRSGFVQLEKHAWRCKKTTQAQPPIEKQSRPLEQPQDRVMNHSDENTPIPTENNYIKCTCGKKCKGRRGLTMHQRSCKTHHTLHQNCKMTTSDNTLDGDESEELSDSDDQRTSSPSGQTTTEFPTIKKGIKLPKTDAQWEEANLFFKINMNISEPIFDLHSYTESFHNLIYNYFADNFGTVDIESSDYREKYATMTMRELKRALKQLKETPEKGNEIQFLSKFIRNKLKPSSKINLPQPTENHSNLLKQNFWKTCDSLFKSTPKIIPTFTVKSCYEYFSAILSATRKIKIFKFPDWIPTLNPPLHPCLTTPPSYQEVTKAIRKSKSKSSPCPLDHISVICFKKCPILRTILHKIISECWTRGEIPSCWKKGLTILIYKKGDASDPSNFRPITLQSVPYKILSSIIRNRIYSFLEENNYIDKHVQKGFWPRIDGVAEHTQVLTNLMKDAKRNQRSIVVTLLDLKNAFGEINHKLIISALQYHHIPSEITNLIENISAVQK